MPVYYTMLNIVHSMTKESWFLNYLISVSVGSSTTLEECASTEAPSISITAQEIYCDILEDDDSTLQSSLYPLARCNCPVIHWNDVSVQIVASDCRERLYRSNIDRTSIPQASGNPCCVERIAHMLPTMKLTVGIGTDIGICVSRSEAESFVNV